MSAPASETVHATCVAIGEAGVLIRGLSGAGKSSLALALIERAASMGQFAGLVADDRVRLAATHGRLVARPHPAIAARVEIRGHGIVAAGSLGLADVEACVVRLVIDLTADAPRLPIVAEPTTVILGLALPRLTLDRALRDAGLAAMLVRAALDVSSQPHTRTDRDDRGSPP